MNYILKAERLCLYGHLVSMAFGLAGLLWVMPHPDILERLPAGQMLFRWSIAGGGVVYILLGTLAVMLYICRTLGLKALSLFLPPALGISLGSELLGTSTGFPFGHYSYLSGLGYKVAGLVPFTIPLSWFYLGFSAYFLARSGLYSPANSRSSLGSWLLSIVVGAELLMAWDFVLDPAMSQTAMPFWHWHHPGAFFGMPYQNFFGWLGTGIVFMATAALLWRTNGVKPAIARSQLVTPLVVYLGNFGFAAAMSLAAGYLVPAILGLLVGVLPALVCWYRTMPDEDARLMLGNPDFDQPAAAPPMDIASGFQS